jgi:predicted RNase H-like nuclease
MAPDYRAACAAQLQASDPPRKIAKQIFHIFPKMRELDAALTPVLQARFAKCTPNLLSPK